MLKFAVTRPVTNVVIFGCGGTGSRVVPLVSQLLASHEFTKSVKIILMDGDVVEEKNTKRQLFLSSEVGKNKAEVLARRYKMGFGAKTIAVQRFIPSVEDQLEFLNTSMASETALDKRTAVMKEKILSTGDIYDDFLRALREEPYLGEDSSRTWLTRSTRAQALHNLFLNTTVFISCVDSADARRRILQFIHNLQALSITSNPEDLANSILIDAGNEDLFGQVSYFNTTGVSLCPIPELLKEIPDKVTYSMRIPQVPMPLQKYVTMVDNQIERSCADMDQTLAINNLMASMIFMIFQNLVYGMEMDYHTVYVNTNGSFQVDKMTFKWMKEVMSSSKDYLRGVMDERIPQLVNKELTLKECLSNFLVAGYCGMQHCRVMDNAEQSGTLNSMCLADRDEVFSVGGSSMYASTLSMGSHRKRHFCSMWSASSVLHTSWTEIVWPIIAKAMDAGFIQLSEVIKDAACFSAATTPRTAGIIPFSRVNEKAGVFTYQSDHNSKYLFSTPRALSYDGEVALSDSEGYEKLKSEMIISLGGIRDVLTGEEIKVFLPSVNKSSCCGSKSKVSIQRQNEPPTTSTMFDVHLSLVVVNAILSSMSREDLSRKFKSIASLDNLAIKRVSSVLISSRSFPTEICTYQYRETVESLISNLSMSSGMRAHKKAGGMIVIHEQLPDGVSPSKAKEADYKTFGREQSSSEFLISISGRVFTKPDLELLKNKDVKEELIQLCAGM